MSNVITTQGRTAYTIAAEIRTYEDQLRTVGLYCVFEIGKRLCEAKAMVPAGEWMDYLKNELGYKQSNANNMMRIYKEYNVDGQLPKSQTFGNLDYSQALALLALPANERESFAQEHDMEQMSVRELKAAIKERDEEKAAREAAEAESRDLRQKLLDAQNQAASARNDESSWQAEFDKLNAALNKATAARDKAELQVKNLTANPKIPAAVKDKLIAEAKAKAAAEAEKDLKNQLAAAQEQARLANQAAEDAERKAREAEQKLTESQKATAFADPNTAALKILFDQLQTDFNKSNGYLMKLSAANPEAGAKFKSAFLTLVEEMRKRLV
jgi:hypothetical protein